MADVMLFTIAGSVAMPAQEISLDEAGMHDRADLQEWVLSNPAILGQGVKVLSFEFDGLPASTGGNRDRISVLGLGADGRLVVAELKSGQIPDTDVPAIRYAAEASRTIPETLANQYARFLSRRRIPTSADEALAELQAHAPELSHETLRKPRIVLLARDFSSVVTATVVRLSEMGLDVSLVQISAFRSHVYGSSGSGSSVPMITVTRVYPLRHVEKFTISPERQLANQVEDSRRRVEDASTVRRLVAAESVADGTPFTFDPPNDIGADMRTRLQDWLDADPARRMAQWQNHAAAPLVWDADKSAYTPAGLAHHIVELATGISRDVLGTRWWRDPARRTLGELAPPLSGGYSALYRDFWSRWLDRVHREHPDWTQITALPPETSIRLPNPSRPGTGYGLAFVAGGRLRSDFSIDLGSPQASRAEFERFRSNAELMQSTYGDSLTWEELPEGGSYRIADYSSGGQGGEVTNVEEHAFYIDWMIDRQERLRRAVEAVLRGGLTT
jgi:hypothetical protein